jgi:single-stranded DNA-binding protein
MKCNTCKRKQESKGARMKLIKQGPLRIEGTLAFDPELRFTPSGKTVTDIIVNALDGGTIHCTLWEDDSLAEQMIRGMPIVINGEWKTRRWTDREDKEHTIQYINIISWDSNNN